MIAVPSLQNSYDDFWSGDDAILQPPASQETTPVAERQKAMQDYVVAIRVARETGDWNAIMSGRGEPTRFRFRQISGDVARKLTDIARTGKASETNALVFRCALLEIVGAAGFPSFKTAVDRDYIALGPIAPVAVTNLLDAVSPEIVNELAACVVSRINLPPS
jgi:hypothetical protein